MGKVAELDIEKMGAEERSPVKLNIGAGNTQMDGFTSVDRKKDQEAFPLDYPDDSAEEIYACHILEHFPQALLANVLKDWVRVLKPGGVMRIAVPDFDLLIEAYKVGSMQILPYLFGGQVDEDDVHYTSFNHDTLHVAMAAAGLERIRPFEPEHEDCSQLECSLNLMGYKPTALDDNSFTKIGAILAAPRFGPTMHFGCHHRALAKLRIPTKIIEGCFWWQQLCEGMEAHLEAGMEYVITMDYDSVFTAQDVIELYRLIRAFPEYDAICALQSKRGGAKILFASLPTEMGGAPLAAFDGPVTHVLTGHFGLTIFRGDALREQKRPWMTPIPNEDGRWDNGNVEVDIDFWRRWGMAGRKLGLANRVSIGHMQQVVTWPDERFEPLHQHQQDFTENGAPAGVRH